MPKITRTIKIDIELWKNSKKLAIDENTNLSALIGKLLKKKLEEEKK